MEETEENLADHLKFEDIDEQAIYKDNLKKVKGIAQEHIDNQRIPFDLSG